MSEAIRIDCDRPFAAVLELVRADMRPIARPGAANPAGGTFPAEILAWCENESDEGLGEVERATALRKLDCAAVVLVPAQIHCAGGVVNCAAWIPAEAH